MMSEQAPRINAVTEDKPIVCVICGKPLRSIDPCMIFQLRPLICSIGCLQDYLDTHGATIHCDGGVAIKVPPGGMQMTISGGLESLGLPLVEGEMPEMIVTVEMSPILDQPSESPVKE
jgi:hypothetical protein